MKRRWLLRILFMFPILLSIAGWAWSVKYRVAVTYIRDGCGFGLVSTSGETMLAVGWRIFTSGGGNFDVIPHDAQFINPPTELDGHFFLGFGYSHPLSGGSELHIFAIPYWFYILFFSSILFLVWWKTRPKLNPNLGFPVEQKTA